MGYFQLKASPGLWQLSIAAGGWVGGLLLPAVLLCASPGMVCHAPCHPVDGARICVGCVEALCFHSAVPPRHGAAEAQSLTRLPYMRARAAAARQAGVSNRTVWTLLLLRLQAPTSSGVAPCCGHPSQRLCQRACKQGHVGSRGFTAGHGVLIMSGPWAE